MPTTTVSEAQFTDPAAFDEWAIRWRQRLTEEPQSAAERQAAMRAVNPAFIPRNHRVEAVIAAAVNDDYAPFEELLTVLSKPYEDQPAFRPMPSHRLPDSACCRRFVGRDALIFPRTCERSEAIHPDRGKKEWITSSLRSSQ